MTQSAFTIGRVDSTIHEFLCDLDKPSSAMTYALVTCLDSSFEVAELQGASAGLRTLAGAGDRRGSGLLVRTQRLIDINRKSRIFFGFDEVWFFSKKQFAPKPKELVLSGIDEFSHETIDRHVKWLTNSGCSLGLGDGLGMNFCVKLHGVARQFVELLASPGAAAYKT